MDFRTIEGATEIFRQLNCLGNDNCFFVTYKNTNRDGMKYGLMGATGAIGGAAVFASGMANAAANFEALLINQNELGLGIIPLSSARGVQMYVNFSKMTPQYDKFFFVPNASIEEIVVKNYSFLNKKVQKVNIKIAGVPKIYQLAHIHEKDIPYQEANFTRFMNRYRPVKK